MDTHPILACLRCATFFNILFGGGMRPIRFRAWDGDEMLEWTDMLKHKGVMWSVLGGTTVTRFQHQYDTVGETLPMYEVMQWTGLQDSQGVDIYEMCELDGEYRVIYDSCCYVLQDISTGDIVEVLDNLRTPANERKITREYSPLP